MWFVYAVKLAAIAHFLFVSYCTINPFASKDQYFGFVTYSIIMVIQIVVAKGLNVIGCHSDYSLCSYVWWTGWFSFKCVLLQTDNVFFCASDERGLSLLYLFSDKIRNLCFEVQQRSGRVVFFNPNSNLFRKLSKYVGGHIFQLFISFLLTLLSLIFF